jgi:hypothetical protein
MSSVYPRALAATLVAGHLITSTGCTVWTRTPVTALAEPLPAKMKVWVHDSAYVVHDPVIRNDSLLGWERSGEDKGAEFAWPMGQVDSLRSRKVTASGTILLGVIGAISVLTLIAGAAAAGQGD